MSTRSILYLYGNLHERYSLFPRRFMSQDQVINVINAVINTYGRLQNGRHEINEYSQNALLNMLCII